MKSGKNIQNYDNKTNFDWNKDYKKRPFLEKVAIWGSYYRANPVMFAKDYFPELHMKFFQMILLHMMFMSDFSTIIATRGLGKSFIVAVYVCIRAILYPNSKITICTAVNLCPLI